MRQLPHGPALPSYNLACQLLTSWIRHLCCWETQMRTNSHLLGRQCSLEDPKRTRNGCHIAGTALPGDQLDPATTSSEEPVGRNEPYLVSVTWGKKVVSKQMTEAHAKATRVK